MRVNLIYARAANGVIGQTVNGQPGMPWHLPEDLAHFKQHTQGCPVIMGRTTWRSLPERFRPLPDRLNIVLTRDSATARELAAEGALPLNSLELALAHCSALPESPAEVWVMGGAQVYAQALPRAQRAVVTEIQQAFEGDAYAPALGNDWLETARESHVSRTGLAFDFVTFEKQAHTNGL